MSKISHIIGREVLDSRGNPTVEAQVVLENGTFGQATVPSGASTGAKEALELRDQDAQRYLGKGVLTAVGHINGEILSHLRGADVLDQAALDQSLIDLDGTENKSRLGANALLAVSMAAARARAAVMGKSLFETFGADASEWCLPVPLMNIINGGAHADNNVDMQEFMVVPAGFTDYREALRCGVEIFHALKSVLKQQGHNTAVGDEGGFAPNLRANVEAVEVILAAIEQAGYRVGEQVWLALDLASSEFYRDGRYHLAAESAQLTPAEFVDYLASWVDQYPLISIEDGMAEDDDAGWQLLTARVGDRVQLVGDDLFVTNPGIFAAGIEAGLANAILIKLNQIGTVTETLAAIEMAHRADYRAVISHRSGESADTFIADLAVGTGAGQIKTGSLCRSDRVAKYNQLLRIAEHLPDPRYAGLSAFGTAVMAV